MEVPSPTEWKTEPHDLSGSIDFKATAIAGLAFLLIFLFWALLKGLLGYVFDSF